jgi:CRISPR system Cascade subunit CasE
MSDGAPLFLSLLRLNHRSREVQRDLANRYELHRTLMSCFPTIVGKPEARRACGLLFRLEEDERRIRILLQSLARPQASCLPTNYLLDGCMINTKDVSTALWSLLASGSVLRFRLCANPTRRLFVPQQERRGKGARVDIRKYDELQLWLERKAAASGFELIRQGSDTLSIIANTETVRARKQTATLTFSSVMFEGALRVTDPDRAYQAVRDGIGSGKAFGFGLLSLARAQ